MAKPTIRQVVEATGASRSYACDVLNGKLSPRPLVLTLYREFGWRHPSIEALPEESIEKLEEAERIAGTLPWKAAA